MLAIFVDPTVVGIFAWAVLALTLFQSVSDIAIRQLGIRLLRSQSGISFLTLFQKRSALVGTLWMSAITLGLISAYGPTLFSQTLALIPLCIVPAITASEAKMVAYLQSKGKWNVLATSQLTAALGALSITLPLLVWQRSLIASSLQLALTEIIVLMLLWRSSRKLGMLKEIRSKPEGSFRTRTYWTAATDGLLGWLQGQSDRLLIGTIAGGASLGAYTTAYSASRSVGEAMASGTANVLRPELESANGEPEDTHRSLAEKHLLRSVYFAVAIVLATWLGCHFVLRPLLDASWNPALSAIPILAITSIPIVISWSGTVLLVLHHRLHRSLPIRMAGIAVAVAVGFAAVFSLDLAAWIVLLRDIATMIAITILVGKAAPRRAMAHALCWSLALGATLAVIAVCMPETDFVGMQWIRT